MNKSRFLLAAFLLAFLGSPLYGQIQFSLVGAKNDSYPYVKLLFDAKDANGMHIGTFLPSEFTVIENGIQRPVQSVSCPPAVTPTMSVTLAIDVSISMGYAGRLDNAKSASTQLVQSFSYPPAQTGIIAFDDTTRIFLDYTNNQAAVLASISSLKTTNGSTDFVGAFLDVITGSIDFTKNRAGDRYIIFVTDSYNLLTTQQEQQIISAAVAAKIKIYTVTMVVTNGSFSLRRIATGTGGAWFENVTTKQQADDVFRQITDRIYQYDPCELTYLTSGCETDRNVDVTLRKGASTITRSLAFQIPASSIVSLDASETFKDFGVIPTGSNKTADITLTAMNGSLDVQSITSPVGAFQIISYGGGSNPPFTLSQGQSRTIRIQYTAPDTNRLVSILNIQTTAPCQEEIVLAGGAYQPEPLVLVQPNGGEVLFSSSIYSIKWRGVPSSQPVALEYSTDAGSVWSVITQNAYSFNAQWTVPNTPSNTCLGLVRTPEKRTASKDLNWLPTQPSEVLDIAIAQAGMMLAAAMNDGRIKIYYPETGALIDILPGHSGKVNSLAFSPNCKWLATAGNDGRVKIWETSTGNLMRDLTGLGGQAHSVAFSRDGSYLAGADQTSIIVWKTSDWTQYWAKNGNTAADGALAIAPDNSWIASASGNQVAILQFSDGSFQRNLAGHSNAVRSLAISNDGAMIASGSDDRTIRLWEVNGWQLARTLSGHTNGVTSVNLSSAGLNVVSSSKDRSIRVWDVRTGQLVQTFTGHTSDVNAVRYDNRLGLLASGGNDRTIRAWGYTVPMGDKSDSLWSIITPTTTLQTQAPKFKSLLCPDEFSDDVVFIKNVGNQSVTISTASFTGSDKDVFSFVPGTSIPPAKILLPEDTLILPVRFAPTTAGAFQAILKLTTDAPSLPTIDIVLQGIKDSAGIFISNDTITIDELYTCTIPAVLPIEIQNTGTVDARLDSLSSTLIGIVDFSSQLPKTLLPGAIDTIWVSVYPMTFGAFSGTVDFLTTPCNAIQSLRISGMLSPSTPVAVPTSIDFGYTSVGDTSYQSVVIKNPTASTMIIDRFDLNLPSFEVVAPVVFPFNIPGGDSVTISFAFLPKSEGDAQSIFTLFSSLPCADSVNILLTGSSARKAEINFIGGTFAPLLCPDERYADSTIILENTGGEPLNVISMALSGTHQGDFTILSSSSFIIQPGKSETVRIRFEPKGVGLRTAILTINNSSPQQPALKISLNGKKDSIGFFLSPASIDIGETYHCYYPIKRSVTVYNTGNVPIDFAANISSIPAFVEIDSATCPMSIAAGDSASIGLWIIQNNPGIFNGALQFTALPCFIKDELDISGSFANSAPKASTNNLDFGSIGVGTSSSRAVTLTNPHSSPIRISALALSGAAQFLTRIQPSALPIVIQPGGSVELSYIYAPNASDTFATALLAITDQPCIDTVIISLKGNSQPAFSEILLPDLTAEIGTTIRIPIQMIKSGNLALTGTRSFKTDILFNRSMLWPIKAISATGATSFTSKAEGATLRVSITVDQTASPANGALAELECLVMLGNDDKTSLTFDTFTWLNGVASVTTKNGSFAATGICEAGGKRLMALPGTVSLYQNTPNPFNPITEIVFILPDEMFADLRVYDAPGKEIRVLVNGIFPKGVHTISFNAESLPSGLYYYILRAGGSTQMKRMMLVK